MSSQISVRFSAAKQEILFELSFTRKAKFDLATRVRAWVKIDLDLQISMDVVRQHLNHFMESRKTLCDRLRTIEAKIDECRHNGTSYDMYIEEMNTLTESIQCQTQQISDLQQKLMDAGERASTDASSGLCTDSTGPLITSRLSQLHNIQEAKIALKYLFKQASSSEVSKINLETQIFELESQLNTEKQKVENLLQITEQYSMDLCKSEEKIKDIQLRLQLANESIDQLKQENVELREASKIQHDNLMKIKTLMTTSPPVTTEIVVSSNNKLLNTPLIRQQPDHHHHQNNNIHNCTFTLSNDDHANDGDENMPPITTTLINQPMKPHNQHDDDDEPGMKYKKLDNEWSLPLTVTDNDDRMSTNDTDSHQPRCKCRGTCQSRCSCKRSNRSCNPSHCQCVLGLCRNRTDSSLTSSSLSLESNHNTIETHSTTLMGPPLMKISRPKRKTRALQLNLNVEQQQQPTTHASVMMNQTFDLNKASADLQSPPTDDLQQPEQPLADNNVSLRYLWPKNRLSYFPSPLLRSDR
ncbi:unnamed protein product [Schistosoma turkestanicum]|nr:unnamed protein product [Schistosoma turkestanicum]